MSRRPATIAVCLSLLAAPAHADSGAGTPPQSEETQGTGDEARELFERGVALLEQQRFDEALELFTDSYRLEGQPVVLLNIGMCQKVLGNLPAAHETLSRYLDEVGPSAHGELVEGARQALVEIEAATGTLFLQLEPPGAVVLVDGGAPGTAPTDEPLRLLPGPHELEAHAEGYETVRQTVDVGAGEAVRLVMRLLPGDEDGPSGLAIGAWLGVGVAAAAGIAATVTGSLGLVARDEFVEGGATDAALRERVVDLGLATDVLLGVAAAGAATALVLFLVDAYSDEAPSTPDDPGTEPAVRVLAAPGGFVVAW